MNWRVKAAVQRVCSALPWGSEALHYGLQRTLGKLRNPASPAAMLEEAVILCGVLRDAGVRTADARVLEVGTGRRVDIPFGLFLAGAEEIHTVDLHRYLKPALVEHSLSWLRQNEQAVAAIYAPLGTGFDFKQRYRALTSAGDTAAALRAARIHYYAPADAANTALPAGSIDIHTSYTVFEHIPREKLREILKEARRLLAPSGVVLHHIDLSDHFYQEDANITKINFLQFSDEKWDRYSNNQFAYHNRLRTNEFRALFEECGYEILSWHECIDERALALLNSGFRIDNRFVGLSPEILCCDIVRVLARPVR
jgi:SAM-dependent methyltransferase